MSTAKRCSYYSTIAQKYVYKDGCQHIPCPLCKERILVCKEGYEECKKYVEQSLANNDDNVIKRSSDFFQQCRSDLIESMYRYHMNRIGIPYSSRFVDEYTSNYTQLCVDLLYEYSYKAGKTLYENENEASTADLSDENRKGIIYLFSFIRVLCKLYALAYDHIFDSTFDKIVNEDFSCEANNKNTIYSYLDQELFFQHEESCLFKLYYLFNCQRFSTEKAKFTQYVSSLLQLCINEENIKISFKIKMRIMQSLFYLYPPTKLETQFHHDHKTLEMLLYKYKCIYYINTFNLSIKYSDILLYNQQRFLYSYIQQNGKSLPILYFCYYVLIYNHISNEQIWYQLLQKVKQLDSHRLLFLILSAFPYLYNHDQIQQKNFKTVFLSSMKVFVNDIQMSIEEKNRNATVLSMSGDVEHCCSLERICNSLYNCIIRSPFIADLNMYEICDQLVSMSSVSTKILAIRLSMYIYSLSDRITFLSKCVNTHLYKELLNVLCPNGELNKMYSHVYDLLIEAIYRESEYQYVIDYWCYDQIEEEILKRYAIDPLLEYYVCNKMCDRANTIVCKLYSKNHVTLQNDNKDPFYELKHYIISNNLNTNLLTYIH